MASDTAQYIINATGEKVLAPSLRPDGTLRKERRIRAGYTPQDEQPVYQSGGVTSRQNIPRCPGLAPEQASSSGAAKSKAAKKNEKRKAKKADGGGSEPASKPAAAAPSQAAATAQPQRQQPQPAAPAAAPAADAGAAAVDKQIKALSKKVRQCQVLLERVADGGDALSAQESDKVAKMPGWQEEIRHLEHQLAKLGV